MAQSSLKLFSAQRRSSTVAVSAAVSAQRNDARMLLLWTLPLLLISLFMLRVGVGSVNIPLHEIVTVLLGGEASKDSWTQIILNLRLPGAVTAVLAGAALSVGGLLMQTLFRNPLAGPDVLGVTSGASLGVAVAVLSAGAVGGTLLAGVGLADDIGMAAAAVLGAAGTLLLIMAFAQQVRSGVTLLILGLMFGFVTSAVVSLLLFFSIPEQIQAYISWTFGSFDGVYWQQIVIFAPAVLLALLAAYLLAKPLNALLLGETYARSMGLNVRRVRLLIIFVTAVLAGLITAFCGPIGFIGIAVPHLCRGVFNTADHRILIPAAMLIGGIMALVAGLIAQVPGSQTILPLNPVTAVIGAPVVIWVILRGRQAGRLFAT